MAGGRHGTVTDLGLRWGDGVIALAATGLVAMAFILAWSPGEDDNARTLVITQAGEPTRHEALDGPRLLELQGPAGTTRVELEAGRARCAESPGTRNICEGAGWLSAHGDMAISLPNRLTLRVEGAEPAWDSIHY
ncbi:NusG domain II-containing protein [Thioalkalivibrio sp. ALJ24]|uniref:NusG domain II-containing protein n=1 Tax=Thioalkalivibrio sp. ALJ24 TaxID=545276 RepID=UPI0003799D96